MKLKCDVAVVEIGSTTTVLSLFSDIGNASPHLIAQGESLTTVLNGDASTGVERAIDNIRKKEKVDDVEWDMFLASSSAAGGLKMTVHGLVYDMTVKAAKEAAMGAGAIIMKITAGKMSKEDLKSVRRIRPNIILLAGGVDYGETETVLHNANLICNLGLNVPVIYAGNVAIADRVCNILERAGIRVMVTENVYPKIDMLNVKPTREIIRKAFAQHIIYAPGMEKIADIVDKDIIPTPAAVMDATTLLSEMYGDVMTIDIGGATTDVDSVTDGSPEIRKIMTSPEPHEKRTVEGDLGVFINAPNVIKLMGKDELSDYDVDQLLKDGNAIPTNEFEERFTCNLAAFAARVAVERHAGEKTFLYSPVGRVEIASGKDLTAINHIFGTGGVLTRSHCSKDVLEKIKQDKPFTRKLLPPSSAALYIDREYIFAPIGILSRIDKGSAITLLKADLKRIG